MKLTAAAVVATLKACMPDSAHASAVEVEGVHGFYRYDSQQIAALHGDIVFLLGELPTGFHADGGGGRSFLDVGCDRHGAIWTEDVALKDQLICLGIAAGVARWLGGRAGWASFPGGMPYVTLTVT